MNISFVKEVTLDTQEDLEALVNTKEGLRYIFSMIGSTSMILEALQEEHMIYVPQWYDDDMAEDLGFESAAGLKIVGDFVYDLPDHITEYIKIQGPAELD
jgi:hypothetical protein